MELNQKSIKVSLIVFSVLCVIFNSTLCFVCSTYHTEQIIGGGKKSEILLCFFCGIGLSISIFTWYAATKAIYWSIYLCVIVFTLLLIAHPAILFIKYTNIDVKKTSETIVEEIWHMEEEAGNYMKFYETKNNCCGLKGHEDYKSNGMKVPPSCYDDKRKFKNTGCYDAAYQKGKRLKTIIVVVLSCNILAELIALIFLCLRDVNNLNP